MCKIATFNIECRMNDANKSHETTNVVCYDKYYVKFLYNLKHFGLSE